MLRNAIALHYVRNPQALDVHEQTFDDAFRDAADGLAATSAAAEAFRRRYRLEPAGPESRRVGAEELLAGMKERFTQGALFRLRVQDLFETVCERFQNSGVEVLSPAAAGSEFLIGDTPALTVHFISGAAGVRAGVSLAAANTVMLPLTPRLLVCLGPATKAAQVPPGFVELVNHVQVRAARQHVLHRLNVDFSSRIPAWRVRPAPAFTGPEN